MPLEQLVMQVKMELKSTGRYDMRTFAFIQHDEYWAKNPQLVEFFVYERPSFKERGFVRLLYDLSTGDCLCDERKPHKQCKAKRILGYERQGVITLFPV
ncbi:MAG: hypothetical protein LBI13_01625 [Streptococcaceae bacterium]|jgi:hypothetical protein|nr:hypothetical protein [Streptococcaceae bacterium]